MALLRLQEQCSLLRISSSHLPNPLKPQRNPRRNQLLPPNAAKNAAPSEIGVAGVSARRAAPWREALVPVPVAAAAAVASWPLPSLAAEGDGKVSLESIVVAIDDFNNRNPFFMAGVVFVWLVVIPLLEEYVFKKYKPVSAIDAFRKVRDVPEAQLLDIRRGKSVRFMAPPNLKLVGKSAVEVEFDEEDDKGFVKEVLARFPDPANTVVCVLDNFDDNSLKVAELLIKNGFKEAYAIKGGLRGPEGWQAVQENYLPPSVHVFARKKKGKTLAPADLSSDGADGQQEGNREPLDPPSSFAINTGDESKDVYENPNYPDLKPPTSPTPSKLS
ncbi:rhodanese-like domain-containing protein 4A, chloroplastic [Panicum virgatum]|uniref:Rhodanese domain-containing protein n=1 Tax=Panicum virgatum TaxID=38727 RepID=A0A8T0SV13_PANVG|nr:rhodanese-like domain-containing protein 4A, chloroplastic [Panicum virgatum]KAG2602471.1 hypothetical protein PVAP13_5KG682700 [Panicum virgatum]